MAFIIADRVRESSVSTGTGNFTLGGAVTGYQTFASVMATSDTTYYTIADQGGANWEVGIGTFTSPSTLARTTILSSSNSGSVVTFGAGTKDVFISLPASKTNVEDQPNLIEVNSSSAALRITQTGAGNALVVEDSANPDSTPFVVDASGFVIQGYTANLTGAAYQSNSGTPFSGIRWNAASTGPSVLIGKSRSATIGTNAIVLSGDTVGSITFTGDDGAAFIPAATITAAVDGTPGTNDMPGRLVFSTTADGASTATERMRIDNLGRVGFGGAGAFGNSAIGVRNNMSGFGQTTNYAVRVSATFDSAATSAILSYSTASWTGGAGASPYTTTSVTAYDAATFTLGTNQTVTNLYGFVANSGLTVATNNYGFYSNIASGTGRWNFYANGTADNYFAGQVQLGAGTAAAPALSTTGDTNTGIFFPAADTIAFSEGGAESMRIDSSGNVGIGTSSPGSTLDVNGAITGRAVGGEGGELRLNNPTNASVGMYVDVSSADSGRVFSVSNNFVLSLGQLGGTGGAVLLYTAATERFRVGPLGQLGINGANYGTSGQVLTSNGSGSAPSWQTASSTGALKNVQVFTSSGTYTRTSGVTTAVVICRGGGGGSTAFIGTAGTGGTTSFGSHVTAVGGSGSTSNAYDNIDGGNGGTGGTGATIAIRGAPGGGTVVQDSTGTTTNLRGYGGGEGGGVGGTGPTATAGVRGGGASGGQRLDGATYRIGAGGGQGEFAMKYTTTVGATETVTIGAGGTAGTGGAAGGAGYIIVYEYS